MRSPAPTPTPTPTPTRATPRGLAALLLIALVIGRVVPAGEAAAQPAELAPDPAMLAQLKAAAAPGPEHRRLEPMVGDWDVATTVWPAPGAPPITFKGVVGKRWILGGRFLEERLRTTGPMGEPMEGLGYLGYDRGVRRYQGMWMATDRTGMVAYQGTVDGKGTTFSHDGVEADPTGQGPPMEFSMVVVIESGDRHVLTQFYEIPGRGRVRSYQMVHTRRRSPAL